MPRVGILNSMWAASCPRPCSYGAGGVAEELDDLAGVLARTLDDGLLDGLHHVAVLVLLEEDAGAANLELKALATHGLHEDGQVQDATAGNLDAGLVGSSSMRIVTLFSGSV